MQNLKSRQSPPVGHGLNKNTFDKTSRYGKQAVCRTTRVNLQVNKSSNLLHHNALNRSGQFIGDKSSAQKAVSPKAFQTDLKSKTLSIVSESQEIGVSNISTTKLPQESLENLINSIKHKKTMNKNSLEAISLQIKENKKQSNFPLQVKYDQMISEKNSTQEGISISQCETPAIKSKHNSRPQSSPGTPQPSNSPHAQNSSSIISQASSAATESQTLAEVAQKLQSCPLPRFPHPAKSQSAAKLSTKSKQRRCINEKQIDLLFEELELVEQELNKTINGKFKSEITSTNKVSNKCLKKGEAIVRELEVSLIKQ